MVPINGELLSAKTKMNYIEKCFNGYLNSQTAYQRSKRLEWMYIETSNRVKAITCLFVLLSSTLGKPN